MFQPRKAAKFCRKISRGYEKIRAGPIGSVGGPATRLPDRKGGGAKGRAKARLWIMARRGTPYVLGLALLVLTNFQEICSNGMLSRCSYIFM